jgi:hypothetical protein
MAITTSDGGAGKAQMTEVQPRLYPDLIGFNHRLPHLTESLSRHGKVKIVAIGSSSTAGTDGGVVPFPPRLEQALRLRFFGRAIDVVNRGIGGQEAPEELARFEKRRACGSAGAGDLAGRHQRGVSSSRLQL